MTSLFTSSLSALFPSPLAAWFMTPWFAWAGAGLASIPIIIHILNRRRFKVVRWAAMEYLLQAMRKNRRRLKFEQWILLAIRCLLIFLMGLALARPLGCDSSTIAALGGQRTALHVIVIDNSYSMGYEQGHADAKTHLGQAKVMAKKIIDRLNPGSEAVMIITASTPVDTGSGKTDPHAVTGKPTFDLQSARSAIERIEQTSLGTDLNGAFQLAIRVANEEKQLPRRHLYIFTDGTRSAFEGAHGKSMEALKQTGPELVRLFGRPHLFSLGKQNQWNQAVLDIHPMANLVTTKFGSNFSAVVKGYGAGPNPVIKWELDRKPVGNASSIKLDIDTQPQSLSNQKFTEGGAHVLSVSLSGEDRLGIDNTRWRIVDVASELRVLIVEGERGIGPLQGSGSFLELALSPPKDVDPNSPNGGQKSSSYVAPEAPIGELELQNKVLANYRAVFLTNVGQINPGQGEMLKKYVEAGGTLVIFVGPAVNSDSYNKELAPRGLLPGHLVKVVSGNDKPFHFDFQPEGNLHPYLREFRGQKNSGLSTAAVETYWQLVLPANSTAERVLDYQGSKDPAITAHSLGKGRVVFFSTTANGDWNTLTPKPAYVALMHEILAGSVGANDRWMNLMCGDWLVVPQSMGLSAAPRLYDDAKKIEIAVEAVTAADGVVSYRSAKPLTNPGLYRLATGNRSIPIAVNVPDSEADVRVLPSAAIKKAMGDIDVAVEDESTGLAALKADNSNDWSWAFMAMVLMLAGAECFFAMRFGHYRRHLRGGGEAAVSGAQAEDAFGYRERRVMPLAGRVALMIALSLLMVGIVVLSGGRGSEWWVILLIGVIAGIVQLLFGPPVGKKS